MFTITLDSSDMKQNLVRLTRSHIQCAASDREYVIFFIMVAIDTDVWEQ